MRAHSPCRYCTSRWGFRSLVTRLRQSEIPRGPTAHRCKKTERKTTVQCDERWSFVKNKKQKQWVWLAIDKGTGEIVGLFVGDRGQTGAKGLWDSLPAVYRQCAVCYTDFWEAYSVIFPAKRHKAVGKESGKTHKIERFNCTLRQRVSRLVRKTRSFSKTIENHIGAIGYFIHHYNRILSIVTWYTTTFYRTTEKRNELAAYGQKKPRHFKSDRTQ